MRVRLVWRARKCRYLELEETCLQYKTKHQLLNKIDPVSLRKHEISDEDDELEAFLRGT